MQLVVLGSGGVGKSCITIQYIQGHFVDRYDATIEDIYRKSSEIDGITSVLTIIDTAGQDGFTSMREHYMIEGDGFLLVYSVTDPNSLVELRGMYASLLTAKGKPSDVKCIVVGNKTDLTAQRAVSTAEGEEFAAQLKCPFIEISAKSKENVEKTFLSLVRVVRNDTVSNPLNNQKLENSEVKSETVTNDKQEVNANITNIKKKNKLKSLCIIL